MPTQAELDDATGRITVSTDFRLKDHVKEVPGALWDGDRRIWTIPKSWPAAMALGAEFGESLEMGPGLLEWVTAERTKKKWLAAMRYQLEVDTPPDVMMLPGFSDLFGYQRVASTIIDYAFGYIICDETGTGKSRSGLAALAQLAYRLGLWFPTEGGDAWGFHESFPTTLITAPKSMLYTWAFEIQNFFPCADVRVVSGTPTNMRKALEPGGHFYVMSYDSLRTYGRVAPWGSIKLKDSEREDKELQALNFGAFIADEAHRVKDPTSVQTRALWAATPNAWFRVAMTGTPVQESPMDLYPLLYLVAPHEYPTKSSYLERYMEMGFNAFGGQEIIGLRESRKAEYFSNLDTRMRRITKEVALPFLPPKLFELRWVDLPPKMRKAYKSMQKDLIAELESGGTLTADSVLERAGRLTQLANASGELYMQTQADGSEKQKYRMAIPSPKIDAFIADVKAGDYDGHSVVIYSDSRQLADLLLERMVKEKLPCTSITGATSAEDRELNKEAFQAGAVQFIVITRAGGEGITLTRASIMCRLMRSWSLIKHKQGEDRVHRIGSEQHDSVTIIDYLTVDTIEERQLLRLADKEGNAQEVLRDDELLAMIKG